MPFNQIIPSHKIASWLLNCITEFLAFFGLENSQPLKESLYVCITVCIALLIGWSLRRAILFIATKIITMHRTELLRTILHRRIFSRCSHVIPPLVIIALLPFSFGRDSELLKVCIIILRSYIVFTIARAISVINGFIWTRIDKHENHKNLPLKGILYVCNGIVWIIAVIIIGSILLNKSPVALLTGLGAFATVLMLVFKDSILGFVAGVQLSQNDMLRVGDWIVVPATVANGVVIDVSLTAVKVQNWDNSIVTLPPYTLISTSFQNWRGMTDSGLRLINFTLLIDPESVSSANDALLEKLSTLPGMANFINQSRTDTLYTPGLSAVNGTLKTNLGLFRAYLCNYLINHPKISNTSQILVCINNPSNCGLPLQIYCYSSPEWTSFEAVKSEIIEHIASSAPLFKLKPFTLPLYKN